MLTINFNPFPFIEAPRLVLRRMEKTDATELFVLRSDKRVMEFLDRPLATTVQEASLFIQNVFNQEKSNDAVMWAITLKGDGKLIGTICYWNIKKEHHRAEIGYMLHPDHHGKGIMQEAITEVLDYGFQTLKLHSVEANVNPYNSASIKILERNKFVREAYFKENYFYNGRFLDTAIYSLLTHVAPEMSPS